MPPPTKREPNYVEFIDIWEQNLTHQRLGAPTQTANVLNKTTEKPIRPTEYIFSDLKK